jgi:hypothetical protein
MRRSLRASPARLPRVNPNDGLVNVDLDTMIERLWRNHDLEFTI